MDATIRGARVRRASGVARTRRTVREAAVARSTSRLTPLNAASSAVARPGSSTSSRAFGGQSVRQGTSAPGRGTSTATRTAGIHRTVAANPAMATMTRSALERRRPEGNASMTSVPNGREALRRADGPPLHLRPQRRLGLRRRPRDPRRAGRRRRRLLAATRAPRSARHRPSRVPPVGAGRVRRRRRARAPDRIADRAPACADRPRREGDRRGRLRRSRLRPLPRRGGQPRLVDRADARAARGAVPHARAGPRPARASARPSQRGRAA